MSTPSLSRKQIDELHPYAKHAFLNNLSLGNKQIKTKEIIMELELKHLAAYLPYGLKLKNKKNETGTLSELNIGRDEPITMYDVVFSYSDFESIKPILRPLSDLTKEITVNGETFVPIYRLIKEDKAFIKDKYIK